MIATAPLYGFEWPSLKEVSPTWAFELGRTTKGKADIGLTVRGETYV
jgi:hypothetical protein